MAVTYGFYNALNHDRLYDAIQMSSIFDGIIRDGIFSTIGDHMVVSAPEDGWYVNVGSGRAWFNHTWTLNDTDYPIEPEEAEVVLDRIDAVILEVNAGAEVRANSIKFLKGTPSSEPVKPTLTHNAEVNQYALAYVHIRAGQTTIFQTDVENAIGTDETPFITGLLQQVSIETLLTQWEAEFNTYFTNFQSTSTTEFNNWLATKVAEYTLWYAQMQTDMDADFAEFDAWFQRMKDQLSEDAAGHLQAEIDELAEAAQKGSIVTVTTTDPTLFNRPVTISQTGFDPVTSSFNASGVAYFETVPMVGDVVIEATNGTLTAHGILNIPYFGRYNTTLEFWTATLNMSTGFPTLYNRQITISSGQITVGTTTFDATGHATFDVHSAGNYHISATDSSSIEYTADVTVTEETTYNVEVPDVPDGSIVEPVNSIPVWLKCANLNKSYTTLAEVLADTETYETLLADSNACQYMKRSTGWAGMSNLVPKMTSNTTPEGTVSYSSQYSGYPWWWAFDGNIAAEHDGMISGTSGYVAYTFTSSKKITEVSFYNRTGVGGIKDFTVDYLDTDGTTWRTVYSGSATQESSKVKQEFVFDNDISSNTWRINILNGHGATNAIGLNGLQFQLAGITTSQDAMARLGKFDYACSTLLSDSTWSEAITNSDYTFVGPLVPTMTSNNTPEGTCICSSEQSSYKAYMAFDGTNSTEWMDSHSGVYANDIYVGYTFTKKCIVTKYYILYDQAVNCTYKLQGSNDGENWVDIGSQSTLLNGYVQVPNANAYLSYRIYIISAQYPNQQYGQGRVVTLQFYGRASEEVLVPLVPTMTSNTTPSGVCSADTEYSTYLAWKAFDGSTASSDGWIANSGSFPHWIKYEFPSAIKVNAAGFRNINGNHTYAIKNYKIQGSNDDESWIDLYTGINNNNSNNDLWTVNFDNSTAYKYYRVYIIDGWSSNPNYRCDIGYIQFYTKTVQTNIIHSAANDTIYMLEDGDPIVLATTNSDGDGILDFSQLPAGPVTLYSSVAKNPDDLTADYSKTITITKTQYGGTTEAYLMPINTLYWYGYESDNLEDMNTVNGWNWSSGYNGTPTRNTNNMTISGSSNLTLQGVGSKNTITSSSVKCVCESTSTATGYTQMVAQTSKNVGVSSEVIASVDIQNGLNTISTSATGYARIASAGSGHTTTLDAFWYE